MVSVGSIVSFNTSAVTNIGKFCADRHITGVISNVEHERCVIMVNGFDTAIYESPKAIEVVAGVDDIKWINFGI